MTILKNLFVLTLVTTVIQIEANPLFVHTGTVDDAAKPAAPEVILLQVDTPQGDVKDTKRSPNPAPLAVPRSANADQVVLSDNMKKSVAAVKTVPEQEPETVASHSVPKAKSAKLVEKPLNEAAEGVPAKNSQRKASKQVEKKVKAKEEDEEPENEGQDADEDSLESDLIDKRSRNVKTKPATKKSKGGKNSKHSKIFTTVGKPLKGSGTKKTKPMKPIIAYKRLTKRLEPETETRSTASKRAHLVSPNDGHRNRRSESEEDYIDEDEHSIRSKRTGSHHHDSKRGKGELSPNVAHKAEMASARHFQVAHVVKKHVSKP